MARPKTNSLSEGENKDFVITKELQDYVASNPKIKEVYFDEEGNHYFHKHKIKLHEDDGKGFSKGFEEVDAVPGAKLGVLKVKFSNGTVKDMRVNVSCKKVALTATRQEIIEMKAVSKPRSEKEKIEILTAAADISKGADFEKLMEKLKSVTNG